MSRCLTPLTLQALVLFVVSFGVSPVAVAQNLSSLSCDDLWFERNKVFFNEGYCFKTPEGQSVFGTQCHSPFGRLTRTEEDFVATIKGIEAARRCPSAPASSVVLANLQQRIVGARGQQNPVVVQQDIVVVPPPTDSGSALTLARSIGILASQVQALTAVLNEQKEEKAAASGEVAATIDETVSLIEQKLDGYQQQLDAKETAAKPYLTSIKPDDKELYMTARKVSEVYPRVPFYIPGTDETGEFWVQPQVSDTGDLRFSFKFIDKDSTTDKVRTQIEMDAPQLSEMKQALLKIAEWSETAHREKIARSYAKRVTCFPIADCPADEERIEGRSSTEVRFMVYENGGTGGRIQRNKGRFIEGYNFSTDSAKLLQAYISYVMKVANHEYRSGTQTKTDLDKIFK